MALRYLVIQAHYRSQLNFTWEGLQGAQNAYDKLVSSVKSLVISSSHSGASGRAAIESSYLKLFTKALSDDLNTSKALAVMWDLIGDSKVEDSIKLNLILKIDEVFGLELNQIESANVKIPSEILDLQKQYEGARAAKNYVLSDKIRDQVKDLGFEFKTTATGTEITSLN